MSDFLAAKAALGEKPITESPSWTATMAAKAAWNTARLAGAPDEPTKRAAYVALMKQSAAEADIPWRL